MTHYYAKTVANIDWKSTLKRSILSKVIYHGNREANNYKVQVGLVDIDWKSTLKRGTLSKVMYHGNRKAKNYNVENVFTFTDIEVIQ